MPCQSMPYCAALVGTSSLHCIEKKHSRLHHMTAGVIVVHTVRRLYTMHVITSFLQYSSRFISCYMTWYAVTFNAQVHLYVGGKCMNWHHREDSHKYWYNVRMYIYIYYMHKCVAARIKCVANTQIDGELTENILIAYQECRNQV